MSEYKEIVAEKVRSGEYFDEALKWYNSKFVRPKTDLTQFSIITIFSLVFFVVSAITFISIFPISKKEPFIVSRSLEKKESITISDINIDKHQPTLGFINYLLKEYVISREEYIEDRINRNFRFVTEMSNDEIFDQYLTENDMSNPNNPILLYGKQARVEIDVRRVELPKLPLAGTQTNPDIEYTAKVIYFDNLIFNDNQGQSQRMQADIKFKYKEIIVDQDTHDIKQLPEVIVTGYKTKEI